MMTTNKARISSLSAVAASVCLALMLSACGTGSSTSSTASEGASASSVSSSSAGSASSANSTTSASSSAASESSLSSTLADVPTRETIVVNDTIANSANGEHAIQADGSAEAYSNVAIQKTGDSDGDEADFYGENAAVLATNGATLDLSEILLDSDGAHANGVFSYGEGTTVNVVDSVIETLGNCSGGLMTTGGGTMNAENLRITTSGNSSAAIRSDRGGGTVNVDRGVYTTSGTGSPVIYSTADITVSDASLESTASQGVVVEGKNSVTLNDVALVADNNTKNSNKSDVYQAVMIYQSMSGDAASGEASFAMNGGSLDNKNGDVFFVNNTVASINLTGASIVNEGDGVFLRAAAAGWGSEGSNGGQVTLNASNQTIDGDMVVDGISNLNLYLSDGSAFNGAVNADGAAGDVYVELGNGSKWVLTGDSHISSLTCDADSIDLNGHALYVGEEAYVEGTASTGEPIAVVMSESSGGPGGSGASNGGSGEAPGDAPDSASGDAPSDKSRPNDGSGSSSKPPSKPSGSHGSSGSGSHGDSDSGSGSKPPRKPSGSSSTTDA